MTLEEAGEEYKSLLAEGWRSDLFPRRYHDKTAPTNKSRQAVTDEMVTFLKHFVAAATIVGKSPYPPARSVLGKSLRALVRKTNKAHQRLYLDQLPYEIQEGELTYTDLHGVQAESAMALRGAPSGKINIGASTRLSGQSGINHSTCDQDFVTSEVAAEMFVVSCESFMATPNAPGRNFGKPCQLPSPEGS